MNDDLCSMFYVEFCYSILQVFLINHISAMFSIARPYCQAIDLLLGPWVHISQDISLVQMLICIYIPIGISTIKWGWLTPPPKTIVFQIFTYCLPYVCTYVCHIYLNPPPFHLHKGKGRWPYALRWRRAPMSLRDMAKCEKLGLHGAFWSFWGQVFAMICSFGSFEPAKN